MSTMYERDWWQEQERRAQSSGIPPAKGQPKKTEKKEPEK